MVITIRTIFQLIHFTQFRELVVVRYLVGHVVVLLFYVHGKHLRSCRDGQLT